MEKKIIIAYCLVSLITVGVVFNLLKYKPENIKDAIFISTIVAPFWPLYWVVKLTDFSDKSCEVK